MSADRITQTPHLADKDLSADEFGRRHYEALKDPRHINHDWANRMMGRAINLDLADKGVRPDSREDASSGAWPI